MVEFFLAIFLMLAGAWLLGECFNRIGQPALVGQLLAGVVIGPSVLNVVQVTPDLTTVETVALFFIMLLTGLAVRPAKIIAAGRRGAVVSSIAFAIPFAAGTWVAHAFGIGLTSALTVGLTVSITAVPVNAIILMELGLLNTDLGATVIAAGVIDDIISFVALSMIQQFSASSSADYGTIAVTLVKIGVFLVGVVVCERLLRTNIERVRRWTDRLALQMRTQGSFIAMLLILAVGISLLAEWSGLQLVIGAFFAGLLLSEFTGSEKLEKATEAIRGGTLGFFGPLAFTFIGAELVLSTLASLPWLVAALLVVAVASKLVGGYTGAQLSKFPQVESVAIGFLMNSRGFVELVIAATAYQIGLIDQTLFSLVVTIGIITTIISPVASRFAVRRAAIGGRPS